MLDGLDEVAPEHREACVQEINAFRRQHPLAPLAVCSRVAEYEELRVRMELTGAVIIKPLSRAQVRSYLKQGGKPLAGVRWVLRNDETLWELLETPLMLGVVALAYQGQPAAEVRATGSLEQRRSHLFANYTQSMFERRSKVTAYTPEQTGHWLTWLARSLIRNNLSVFYLEWMQPDWLPSRIQQRTIAIVPFIFSALVCGLVFPVPFLLWFGLVDATLWMLVLGMVVGLFPGFAGNGPIRPAEVFRWSWRKARSNLVLGLLGGLLMGLFAGLMFGLVGALAGGFAGWLAAGGFNGLLEGLSAHQTVTRTAPNEGIRRSLRNALIGLSAGALACGLPSALFASVAGRSQLAGAFSMGVFGGLIVGLRFGGAAYLKHHVLSFLMWRNDYAPLNYVRFLDYAAERVFLRKVGGGYIFRHRLLMEYFAALRSTEEAHATKTA